MSNKFSWDRVVYGRKQIDDDAGTSKLEGCNTFDTWII